MDTLKGEHRWFLIIGVVFSISLIIPSLSGISYAIVATSTTNPNIKYYYDDESKVYFDFPASWTLTDQSNSLLFTGDGASLEISAYNPTPGSWFPSVNTPIEQIANNIIKEQQNISNTHLDYHSPLTISNIPAYHIGYSHNQQGNTRIIIDNFIFISGGYLYQIKYDTLESLYDQNKVIRDKIIHSITVGNDYDTVVTPNLKILKDTQAALIETELKVNDIINEGIGSIANGACTPSNYPNTYPNCY
jgi:hypothetical protein